MNEPFDLRKHWCNREMIGAELERIEATLPPKEQCIANAAEDLFAESFRCGLTHYQQEILVANIASQSWHGGYRKGLRRAYDPAIA